MRRQLRELTENSTSFVLNAEMYNIGGSVGDDFYQLNHVGPPKWDATTRNQLLLP